MPAPIPTPLAASVPDARREPVGLEIAGVLLALGGLLLGSAIVTLAPESATRPLANAIGSLGRTVADGLTRSLGAGAYLFAAFPVAWGLSCMRGRAPRSFLRKALLVPVVALLVATLASLVFRRMAIPGLYRSGPGGYLGLALHQVLFGVVGKGASLLVAGLLVSALLLATDSRVRAPPACAPPRRRLRTARTPTRAEPAPPTRRRRASAVAVADEDDDEDEEG